MVLFCRRQERPRNSRLTLSRPTRDVVGLLSRGKQAEKSHWAMTLARRGNHQECVRLLEAARWPTRGSVGLDDAGGEGRPEEACPCRDDGGGQMLWGWGRMVSDSEAEGKGAGNARGTPVRISRLPTPARAQRLGTNDPTRKKTVFYSHKRQAGFNVPSSKLSKGRVRFLSIVRGRLVHTRRSSRGRNISDLSVQVSTLSRMEVQCILVRAGKTWL